MDFLSPLKLETVTTCPSHTHPPPLTPPTPPISVLQFKVAARISPLKLDIVNTFPSHAPSPLVLRLSSIFPLFSVQALVVM